MTKQFTIVSESGSVPVSAISSVDGISHRKYRKELIRAGVYKQGTKTHNVTRDRLTHWANVFQEMKKNGHKIPIPANHDDTGDPDKNRGWVDDVYIDGDSLYVIAEFIGDDAITSAMRSDVSVRTKKLVTDGHGREYKDAIAHVALTSTPLIPKLKGFEPIVASMRVERKTMNFKKLAKAFGIEDELTESNVEDALISAWKGYKKRAKDELTKVRDELTASANDLPVPDSAMVSLAKENIGLKLDALVASNAICPATRDKIAKSVFGEKDGELVACLQHNRLGAVTELIASLEGNKVIDRDVKSGAQTRELENKRAGGDKGLLKADAQRRADEAAKRLR